MDPRLPQSKAWTALPEDFKTQVVEILGTHFQEQAQKGKFMLDGKIFKNEILMRIGYLEKNVLRPVQFDLSIDYDSKAGQPMKFFENLVDLGASLLQAYFKNPDEDFPYEWHGLDFEGKTIFLKRDTTNQELEDIANQLLGETQDQELIHGDLESDDIASIVETLSQSQKKH